MNLLGVDLGTRKVSTAVFASAEPGRRYLSTPPQRLQLTESYMADAELRRAAQLYELSRFVADQALFFEVDQVWIEDVIVGNNHRYSLQLAQVLGAIMAQLCVSVRVIDTRVVDNKVWKKEIVGNGNATKDTIRNYIVETYPDYALLCADDQDRFDACCIGLYGLQITDRASELKLSAE